MGLQPTGGAFIPRENKIGLFQEFLKKRSTMDRLTAYRRANAKTDNHRTLKGHFKDLRDFFL